MYNWHKFKDDIHLAPRKKGVYLLSETNSESGIVYVGRADDLQDRLSQHPDPSNPCLQRKMINYFAFEETMFSASREEELTSLYNPECDRT